MPTGIEYGDHQRLEVQFAALFQGDVDDGTGLSECNS